MAMAGAALYAATQNDIGKPSAKRAVDPDFEKKNKKKCCHFMIFSSVIVFTCWLVIQSWIQSQYGAFEFMGVDAAPEEYKRRIIEFYEIHNPDQLIGDMHRRPVDSLFWKHRYKEKKLWHKIQKKYVKKNAKEALAKLEDKTTQPTEEEKQKDTSAAAEAESSSAKKDL